MHPPLLLKRVVPCLVAALLLMLSRAALADLMLFPTRVEFEKNQRAAQVELINRGTTPETYRISLVNRRMGERGDFIAVDTPGPGEQFADALLRHSPRQVTIAPGSSQTVRIQLRKPGDLAAGEYRSHLQFDRVADADGQSSVEAGENREAGSIGIALTALVGASIPVIVRHGDTHAQVQLAELQLLPPSAQAPATLEFAIQREGTRSVYGDLSVTFTPKGGSPVDVAKAGGVAVYVPNPLRRARMPLQLPEAGVRAGGTLLLTYRERADAGGRVLASATLALP